MNKEKKPRLFLGPMSANLVQSVIDISDEYEPIGLIPSRRQIEWDGGYVNNWKTKEFVDLLRNHNKTITLQRDHGGPMQGAQPDDGLISFQNDCASGFDIIHVDPWKTVDNIEDATSKTIEGIRLINSFNDAVLYEIGTEQAIFPYSAEEMDYFASKVLEGVKHLSDKIIYLVVQTGTKISSNKNTGNYSPRKMIEMVKVCNKKGLLSKEHNGDYLSDFEITDRFKNGLDSINIAPEMGYNESVLLMKLMANKPKLIDEWYKICIKSEKWKKWVADEREAEDVTKIISITGHYTFSHPDFQKIKKALNVDNVDAKIISHHKNKILKILKNINAEVSKIKNV